MRDVMKMDAGMGRTDGKVDSALLSSLLFSLPVYFEIIFSSVLHHWSRGRHSEHVRGGGGVLLLATFAFSTVDCTLHLYTFEIKLV